MSDGRLRRWSPLSGVVFAVLYFVSAILFDGQPGPEASDSTILEYYSDDGNQFKLEAAFLIATIAGVFFIWFTGTLASRLRAAEGETGWLSRMAVVSGGAFVALFDAAAAVKQFAADAADDNPDVFELDPNLARLLTNGAYSLDPEASLPLVAPLVLAASIAAFRRHVLPRWLGWAGLVVTLGCLLGLLGATIMLLLAWVVVVAVCLARREEPRSVTRPGVLQGHEFQPPARPARDLAPAQSGPFRPLSVRSHGVLAPCRARRNVVFDVFARRGSDNR
jgi:hypothetical protein